MRMWVAGAIKQAITNTVIACKVSIDAEQGIAVFNGQQLKSNKINSNTNSNLVLQRDGSTTITKKADNVVQFSGYLHINNISAENDTDMALRRSGTELIRLNSSNQIQLSGDLSLPTSNTQYIRFSNCNIRQGVAGDPAIVYFDFTNDASTGHYRFYIDTNTILHLRPLTTTISNTLEVYTIYK